MQRVDLAARHVLNPPAGLDAIRAVERAEGLAIPSDYVALLQLSNGLSSGERLVLLELEALAARNRDYEVADYLPGYVMIGDDSGGFALVMRDGDPAVYEVGMGAMDRETMDISAPSLSVLLIDLGGKALGERG
jgi:hypothetical protein